VLEALLVIGALAAVIRWMTSDGEGSEQGSTQTQIPEHPYNALDYEPEDSPNSRDVPYNRS